MMVVAAAVFRLELGRMMVAATAVFTSDWN